MVKYRRIESTAKSAREDGRARSLRRASRRGVRAISRTIIESIAGAHEGWLGLCAVAGLVNRGRIASVTARMRCSGVSLELTDGKGPSAPSIYACLERAVIH